MHLFIKINIFIIFITKHFIFVPLLPPFFLACFLFLTQITTTVIIFHLHLLVKPYFIYFFMSIFFLIFVTRKEKIKANINKKKQTLLFIFYLSYNEVKKKMKTYDKTEEDYCYF